MIFSFFGFSTRKLEICMLVLLVTYGGTYAQFSDSLTRKEKGYIQEMTKYLSLRFAASNDLEAFSVDAGEFNPKIYPNTATTLKLGVSYRFLAFSLNFAPSFLPGNDDDELKGKTKNFGLSLGFIHPHWFTSLGYSRHKGYYLQNTSDFLPDWKNGDLYIQFPNMKVSIFEGLTGYNFNRRYSVLALTTQAERQLRSAGTFAAVAGYRLYFVNNLTDVSGQKSQNFEVTLGVGYHFTWVLKQTFYTSIGLTPSVGYIFTKLTTRGQQGVTDDIITNSKALIVRGDIRLALGYNSERFFTGIHFDMRDSVFEQEGTTAINTDMHFFYQVFIGYRMNAPSSVRKTLEKIPLN